MTDYLLSPAPQYRPGTRTAIPRVTALLGVLHRCGILFTNWRQDPPPTKRLGFALLWPSLYCGGLSPQYLRGLPVLCRWIEPAAPPGGGPSAGPPEFSLSCKVCRGMKCIVHTSLSPRTGNDLTVPHLRVSLVSPLFWRTVLFPVLTQQE